MKHGLGPLCTKSELLPTDSPYTIYRRDRNDGYGGVLIAIKDNLLSDPVEVNSDCEIMCRNIQNPGGDSVIVISAYRPPNSSKEYALDLLNAVKDVCIRYPKSILMIGGDLNLPDIEWTTNYIKGHQYLKAINEHMLALEEDLGLSQLVNISN